MALVKNKPVLETPVGQFEDVVDGEQTVETASEQLAQAQDASGTKPTEGDKVKVAATLAVAKASSTAVGAVGKFETALSQYENALPAIDFGVLPRLKGSNGLIMDGDNAKLGAEVQVTLISFNDQFVVTPGVDDPDATKHVKYSTDGITIDSTGQSVAEYINILKTVEGYPDADVKKYCEVIGILNSAEKDTEHLGNMVQLSLSPQSRKSFEAYRLQQSVKIKMGRATAEGSEELFFRAVVKTMGNYTFTILQASDK